ncbi:MAG: sulfurtransferase-like selenium metabolism protein YedF [Desulfovibrio sp.]|uniref:sulfurtransferase-like selenium metabolism protein YedF n=1 Tax=Desulfovibrio sp. TaxID=885 RepID=UPI00135E435D|nr:sulfurtransferase-like selenium metabolism protein YedF [Desulfovibrio sp.]MTJ93336.1 sulfurtransferase-like selenium metabolism protein YedF [Desulfovibrio sp.]
MEQLDCRGLACPQPVIRSRDAVTGGARALEVLVDNEPARENVRRFFEGRGFCVAANQEGPDCWRISATADGEAPAPQQTPQAAPAAEGNSRTLVLITTETIGRGDDVLGGKLMGNFLGTLPELGSRLWRIVLINGGVKLASCPGPALDALKKLEAEGVSVLVCGTCLAHFGLLEAKAVGDTSNMLDIVTSLDLAGKVIRP